MIKTMESFTRIAGSQTGIWGRGINIAIRIIESVYWLGSDFSGKYTEDNIMVFLKSCCGVFTRAEASEVNHESP